LELETLRGVGYWLNREDQKKWQPKSGNLERMEHPGPKYLKQIPPDDWEKTPASVKKMVELMAACIEKLEQQGALYPSGSKPIG
jgi:hypothetical protein